MRGVIRPLPPRAAVRRAFGVVTGLAIVLIGAVVSVGSESTLAVRVAGPGGVALLGIGLFAPDALAPLCTGWNRLLRGYVSFARTAVLRAFHGTLFVAARPARSGLLLDRPAADATVWVTRARGRDRPTLSRDEVHGWLAAVTRRSRGDRSWTLMVLPLLLVLRVLGSDSRGEPAADIYTLY